MKSTLLFLTPLISLCFFNCKGLSNEKEPYIIKLENPISLHRNNE